MVKRLLLTAVILGFCILSSYSQGEIDEQQKIFFRNEKSLAILLNTDGIGLSYRTAKRKDYRNKSIFEIDVATLKHPREYKLSNPYSLSNGSFVFGKLNSVIYIRGGIGHQHELFKKVDVGGIAIRYFYSVGPVIAVYKPIYYNVITAIDTIHYQIIEQKFDPSSIASPYDIDSKVSFTKGLNETKFLPGLYAKGGFNFEYSKEDKIIHAIEIGGQINAFPKEIPIMSSSDNKSIFLSLFISYRFGIIVDPLNPESNKLSNIFKIKKKN